MPRWRNGSRAGLRNQCLRAGRSRSDLGHQFFTCTGSQAVEGIGLQIRQGNLTRVRFSLCAPFFSFQASVAHLDRAPGYEPGGGKFESFQTRHFFPYKQTGCMRLAVNQHRARFDASVRSHVYVGFSSVVEPRVVIPVVISSILISQPIPILAVLTHGSEFAIDWPQVGGLNPPYRATFA